MDIKKLNEAIQEAKEAKIKPIKAIEPTAEEKAFLDEMSKKIENEEGISYGELAELQSLQPQIIFINDIRLAEWAGIPEEVWNISGIDESAEPLKEIYTNDKEEENYQNFITELEEIAKKYGIGLSAVGCFKFWDENGFKSIKYHRDSSSGDLLIKELIFSDGEKADL